jgi:hypothetical protein
LIYLRTLRKKKKFRIFLYGGTGLSLLPPVAALYLNNHGMLYRQIFPHYLFARQAICEGSPFARIKEKRLQRSSTGGR